MFLLLLATFAQLSLQKATFDFILSNFWATFWEISCNFFGNLEQLVASHTQFIHFNNQPLDKIA